MQTRPTVLHMDNQAAIRVARNPEHHSRMKHIDIRHHWLRSKMNDGTFAAEYISTQEMAADIFTKPLAKQVHQEGVRLLGMM